ncbi:PREDICTED: uncharacterized protein LOC106804634 [Priapulus caudatus]|uniref:Uncharacterized protein LOC106804634 n=1 Tax=Priapulus caudatus TaxID=37621 RepID=A0ABM1DN67_PRICU|nr:PREDICTED: uncharacterized protein LOC106804634 [Priapulus caudatus]
MNSLNVLVLSLLQLSLLLLCAVVHCSMAHPALRSDAAPTMATPQHSVDPDTEISDDDGSDFQTLDIPLNSQHSIDSLPVVNLTEHDEPARANRVKRQMRLNYVHLCDVRKKFRFLNDRRYEYRPAFYTEIWCSEPDHGENVQKCAFGALHCVQQHAVLHLSRRKAGSDCWEPVQKEIKYGCECMWPINELGPMDTM